MSSEGITRQEMRTRALLVLDRQREAQKTRLAAPATVGDIEAFANRVNSAISKLVTAIDRLRATQVAVSQELQALSADAAPNPVEVQIYGRSP